MTQPFPAAPLARQLGHVGGRAVGGATDIGDELVRCHAEPHRRYHTAEHVGEVQAELARLAGFGRPGPPDDELVIAAMFHDAVYDVHAGAGASEAASADLAEALLVAQGVPAGADVIVEVRRLILLTAGHEVEPGDEAGALLVDADLWILSAPADRYDRYAADVRAEYAHVPDDGWRVGRSAVLQHFLDAADALYSAGPPDDRAARRTRAVANLTRELAALG